MGFLDIYAERDAREAQFQPNEGTSLPTYTELHPEGPLVIISILVAVVLLVAAFYYRAYLRNALIIALAGILKMFRKALVRARMFWREIENRAD